MKQGIVDRFEGTIAVVLIEDASFEVPRSRLPPSTYEGDYLQVEVSNGEIVAVERDDSATEVAKQRIAEKLDRLRRTEHLPRTDQS